MATTTFRPIGSGSTTQLGRFGDSSNYLCVDEVISDSDTTYVQLSGDAILFDLYTFDFSTIDTGDTINNITVYNVARHNGGKIFPSNRRSIKENGVITHSSTSAMTSTYSTYSTVWSTKPSNGTAWTKTDLSSLEIGGGFFTGGGGEGRLTQVYCIIDYTPASVGSVVVKPIMMFLETDD